MNGAPQPRLDLTLPIALFVVAIGLVLAAHCAGCAPAPGPVGPEPTITPPDPASVTRADCDAAEVQLRALDCGAPGPRWADGFGAECWSSARDGQDWHPRCIARAPSCESADALRRVGCAP